MTKSTATRFLRVTTALSLAFTPTLGVAKESSKRSVRLDTSTPDSPRTIRADSSKPEFTIKDGPRGYTPIPNRKALVPFADNSREAIADRVRRGETSSNPDRIRAQPDRFGNRQLDPRFTTERVAAPRSFIKRNMDHLKFERDKVKARADKPVADVSKTVLTKAAQMFYDKTRDPKIPIPQSRALALPGSAYVYVEGAPALTVPEAPRAPVVESIPAQPVVTKAPVVQHDSIQMDPKYARTTIQRQRLIPSEWGVFLDWKEENTRRMGKRIHDVIMGQTEMSNLKRVEVGGSAAATAKRMNEFQTNALTFGLFLGVAAFYNVNADYPNNPMAVQKYFETMTDPVGWMAISGFVMAMAPFTKMMNSQRVQTLGFAGQLPLFISGLAVASIVQTGITNFARDEDVRKCLGFTDLKGFRSMMKPGEPVKDTLFTKDYAACDRAAKAFYDNEPLQKMFIDSVPAMAAMAISGTAIYSMLYTIQKYFPAQRMMAALNMTAGSTPMTLALRGVYTVGITWLFMTATSTPQEMITQSWGTWLLASAGKEGPRYGKTVERTQSDLFKTWETTKANGWRDADILTDAKAVCFDDKRIGQKYYDCTKPRELDFAGVLTTYSKVQREWRTRQLAPTLSAYNDWTAKLASYRATYSTARAFYKKAIELITFSRRNPNVPDSDPRVFSMKNLDVRTVSPLLWGPVRSLVARLDMFESQDGSFGHVSTPLMQEKLLASMACGPDATGKTAEGFVGGWARTAGEYLSGNYAPRDLIEDPLGQATKFNPPRITTPLPGTSASVCEPKSALKSGFSLLEFTWSRLDAFNPDTVEQIKLNVNGKQYQGLPSYILDNVRTDVITPAGVDQFDAWWQTYVEKQDDAYAAAIKKDYAKVIEGPFKKALVNPEYYWCETGSIKDGSRLERYLSKVGGAGGPCSGDRTHRLAYGVMNNLRDQARLYLAMMVDLYVSNSQDLAAPTTRKDVPHYPGSVGEVENTVLVAATRVIDAYDKFTNAFVNGSDDAATTAAETELNTMLTKFSSIVYGDEQDGFTRGGQPLAVDVPAESVKIKTTGKIEQIAARKGLSRAWMGQLKSELMSVLSEWEGYAKIVGMQ